MGWVKTALFCTAFSVAGLGHVQASSVTESSEEVSDAFRCPGYGLFTRKVGASFPSIAGNPSINGEVSVSISNPSTIDGFASTEIITGINTKNATPALNQIFQSFAFTGCDRLHYHQDATTSVVADSFVLSGTFNYEERVCTSLGSATVATKGLTAKLIVTPRMAYVQDKFLVVSMFGVFEVPLFLNFSVTDELFSLRPDPIEVPTVLAAQIEEVSEERRVNGFDIFYISRIKLREVPEPLACEFKKMLGDAIWETGEFGRAY